MAIIKTNIGSHTGDFAGESAEDMQQTCLGNPEVKD